MPPPPVRNSIQWLHFVCVTTTSHQLDDDVEKYARAGKEKYNKIEREPRGEYKAKTEIENYVSENGFN